MCLFLLSHTPTSLPLSFRDLTHPLFFFYGARLSATTTHDVCTSCINTFFCCLVTPDRNKPHTYTHHPPVIVHAHGETCVSHLPFLHASKCKRNMQASPSCDSFILVLLLLLRPTPPPLFLPSFLPFFFVCGFSRRCSTGFDGSFRFFDSSLKTPIAHPLLRTLALLFPCYLFCSACDGGLPDSPARFCFPALGLSRGDHLVLQTSTYSLMTSFLLTVFWTISFGPWSTIGPVDLSVLRAFLFSFLARRNYILIISLSLSLCAPKKKERYKEKPYFDYRQYVLVCSTGRRPQHSASHRLCFSCEFGLPSEVSCPTRWKP